VRAEVVDGEVLAAAVEHGDQAIADLERPPGSLGDGANAGNGDELGHEKRLLEQPV
jgi:hypothetical protein